MDSRLITITLTLKLSTNSIKALRGKLAKKKWRESKSFVRLELPRTTLSRRNTIKVPNTEE
jgi:hypothetical protein